MPGEGFQGPKCGATTRGGGSCQQPAMPNGRCRMHGGKARKGVGHPNYKHGRYSDYMPQKLLHGYSRQLSDRALLHQRDEIAAIDAMIFDAYKRMSNGESGALWKQLRKKWKEMEEANHEASKVGISNEERTFHLRTATGRMDEVGGLIRRGAYDYQVQDEILNLIERNRRVIESQGKREVQEKLMISYEDASATFHDLVAAVCEVVDEDQRAAIAERFAIITGDAVDGPSNPN